MFETVHALVLREVKYKESDKILTLLTQEAGKITAKARGALSKRSKYRAAAQMFAYSEMTLFHSQGRWTLDEAEVLEQFTGLNADLADLALAVYFADVLEAVSGEDSPEPEILQLALNSLYALNSHLCERHKIKAAFELRLMCLSGYEPDLSGCSRCGSSFPDLPQLSLNGGTIHCLQCPPSAAGRSVSLDAASLAAMRYIAGAPAKRLLAFTLEKESLEKLSEAAELYLEAQLDRGFSSLDYYKQVC